MAKIIYRYDEPFEVELDDGSTYGLMPEEGTLGEGETECVFEAEDGMSYLVAIEGCNIGAESNTVYQLIPLVTEVEELDEEEEEAAEPAD
jgi:hypothetical protein